jgi:hypothetical protein
LKDDDMSSERTDSQTFMVTHKAPLDEVGVPAGVVAIDANQQVAVVSAEAAFTDLLNLATSMVNSSENFLIPAPPPAGASPRTIRKKIVARDAANAREALREVFRGTYRLVLTPV